ncbi:MAG: hypothetical protein ACI9ME_001946, partial [Ilumatobacter sp.]
MTISEPTLDPHSSRDESTAPARRSFDPERLGLGLLLLAGALLVVVGTGMVTGALATLALALTLGTVVALIGA